MKRFVFCLLCCQVVSSVRHSLKYFHTSSEGIPGFPEFVVVGMVDGVQMFYYDSITKTAVPGQDWMKGDPQFWERETEICKTGQKVFKVDIDNIKRCFNQNGGVHTLQVMSGCEWDDETGDTGGRVQYGYNGEDFFSLDMKAQTWVEVVPKVVTTEHEWEAEIGGLKWALTQNCIYWLMKYVEQGRNVLQRTVPPSVSLLRRNPSAPVTCHATGFYPDRVSVFWRRDGEQQHEDVDIGEILPNSDGTFQQSVHLDLSAVKPEDWSRYDCTVQLAGMEEDLVIQLEPSVVRSNWPEGGAGADPPGSPSETTGIIIGAAVGVLVLAGVVFRCFVWRKRRKEKKRRGGAPDSASDSSSVHLATTPTPVDVPPNNPEYVVSTKDSLISIPTFNPAKFQNNLSYQM